MRHRRRGRAVPLPAKHLAGRRRRELRSAVGHLAPDAQVLRLGLPDGRLAEESGTLVDALVGIIGPGDLVLATLDGDGHPDHDAVGAAAQLAAMVRCAELWWFPVWAWHWHDPQSSPIAAGRRVELPAAARRAKVAALAEYASQIGGADAVVPAAHVRRCLRPFEVLVAA
ncbi:MAG: PIG-L family deacetylase [Ilumatobacteraceae bacterium]